MSVPNFVSRISGIEFYPLSEKEIQTNSAVIVTNKNQFSEKDGPEPHGIYDARLGTIYSKYDCASCEQGIRKCPGHYGSYALKYPLCNIIFIKNAYKFLRVICVHCNKFIMNPEKPEYKYSPHNVAAVDEVLSVMLNTKLKQGKEKKIYCDYCNESKANITRVQPQYSMKSMTDQNKIKVKAVHTGDHYKSASGNDYEKTMYNYEILRLFEGLPDSEMIKFGMPVKAHPRHYFTRQLIIIPANMRFINNDNKNSYSNQLTAGIEKIIKANEDIPKDIPRKTETHAFGAYMNAVENLIRQYIEYIKVKPNTESNDAVLKKLTGKRGLTRQSQLGKNVGKVFRVTIVCDTSCPIDTIKVPKHFAQILTVDETVTEYNFNRLQLVFNNGPNYPGYNEITSAKNGKKYDSRNSTYRLQVGDTIHRHIIDGDTVPFHRFPTLTATCTTSMKIIVHRDNTSAVAFNVLACDWFNADYDGDTMMGFVIGHEGIRMESNYIMNMNNNYLEGKVSSGSNISILGQVLDSVIGFALITRNFVKFSRYQVMDLVRDVQINQKLTKEEYTGREVMSLVMPRIKYVAPSPFFSNKTITSFMTFRKEGEKPTENDTRFDESDKMIIIKDGQILSGIVCGGVIKNSPGSLYHKISDQYSSEKANEVLHKHQQITRRYLEHECFSIGYKDLILNPKAHEMIALTQSRIMAQISELNNKLMNHNIVPPLGKDMKTYVNEEILKIHNNAEGAYLWAILHGLTPEENSFIVSLVSGTKGKLGNIYNIFAPLGQIRIDGKRIPSILDYQRYDLWSPQFSQDPHVGGYIPNSYAKGISFKSMYTASKNSRSNVLTKGLVVGEAGSAGRDSIKAFESLTTDNRLFTVRNYGENIVEFAIADDGFESSTLINNDYFILGKTDDEVRSMFTPKIKNKQIDTMIEKIIADKKEFIRIQMCKEATNYTHECNKSLQVPFDINQMIYIVTNDKDETPTQGEYDEMIQYVNQFIDDVHYIKINSVHKKKRTELLRTTWLTMNSIRIALRLYFNPVFLEKCLPQWIKLLCSDISCKIISVLHIPGKTIGTIIGQTLTAPLTQYLIDAHHAAATGGTSRDGLKYYKQVTTLKPVDKLPDLSKRMYVYLKEKYEEDKAIAEELSNYIGTIHFDTFIIKLDFLVEKFGECITYPEDKHIYSDEIRNSEIKKQGLYPIVFRYTLDTYKMMSKNITVIQLAARIESKLNGMCYCMYSESGETLHVYFNSQFEFNYQDAKKSKKIISTWDKIITFGYLFNKGFIVNDFSGISGVEVKSRNKTFIKPDGSIGKKQIFFIQTNGINMKDVLLINVVDKYRTSCSHVVETFEYQGMLASRDKFISEVSNTFITLKLAHNNYNFPANVMFERGYPANLAEKGQKIREPHDALLHSAFKNPINALRFASVNNIHNNMSSPSSNLMFGQIMNIGTAYNEIVFNEKFIKERSSGTLEELL